VTIEDEFRSQFDVNGYPTILLFDLRARGASVALPLKCRIEVLIRDVQTQETIYLRDSRPASLTDEKNRFRCSLRFVMPTVSSRTPAFVGIRVIPEERIAYKLEREYYGNCYGLHGRNERQLWVEQVASVQWLS
jgi:hypothetical protein